jgi:rare lipoprotein A
MADTRCSMLSMAIFRETRCFYRAHLFLFGTLCVFFSFGCAARRPLAGQPPPAAPTATPESTAESAKRSTSVPDTGANPSAAKSGRRAKAIPPPAAIGYIEEGNASWYGAPFHGRRASNGEIYDMHKLTAAHRTLPFDTNRNNGKSAVVRITDRGPFVENRIIDLSFAAAQEIAAIGAGVVPIHLEVVSAGVDPTGGFFTVQVGAFRDKEHAERLRERLNASYSPIFIQTYDSPEGAFYRVRAGKIAGEEAARDYAAQLHAREGLAAYVLRLDESGPVVP